MKKRLTQCFMTGFILLSVFSGTTAFSADNVAIHGFVSQGYLQTDGNNFLANTEKGSFQFNEMGLNFGYDTGSNVTVGAQLYARDLGDIGNDKVGVAWAFGDYKWREWLGMRAGIMKLHQGLYNETRDVDALRTFILLPQSVYNEWFRDISQGLTGIQSYGKLRMGGAGSLDYGLGMYSASIPLDSGSALFIQYRQGFSSLEKIDIDNVYIANVNWYTPLDGLLLGYTGFTTKTRYRVRIASMPAVPLEFSNTDSQISIFSIEYTIKNLVLASECQYVTGRKNLYPVANPAAKFPGFNDERMQTTNYYVSASYRFVDWFEAGLYYSETEGDYKKGGDPNYQLKDVCVSTKFDINPVMIFKLETHFMDGLYGVDNGDDGTKSPYWRLFAAKVSYTF